MLRTSLEVKHWWYVLTALSMYGSFAAAPAAAQGPPSVYQPDGYQNRGTQYGGPEFNAPYRAPNPNATDALPAPGGAQPGPTMVAGIRIIGNRTVSTTKIRSLLKTRINRPFDPETVQVDARELMSGKTKLFQDVKTYIQNTPEGIVVTYEVVELPTIQDIRIVGNRDISTKALVKQTGLKDGDALDVYDVNEARRKIEDYYRSRGYTRTQVSVLEGARPGDRNVVFLVNEDSKQRIWDVEFIGNKVVSDGRLKTQIESKPGFMKYFFKGKVDRRKIEEDVLRLTEYYRGLGYYNAKIGRDLDFDDDGEWLTITFVIHEGPRYRVRNVAVIGNKRFSTEALLNQVRLKENNHFDQATMDHDVNALRDMYGSQGYIFADVRVEQRYLEEPGQMDLVYDIREGEQYRVGRVNVHIAGAYPHTQEDVVKNRISLRPGDIIDIRELRDSERRLKFSQLFVNEPHRGVSPRIVVRPPELQTFADNERASHSTNFRGQSPDDGSDSRSFAPHDLELDIYLPPGYELR